MLLFSIGYVAPSKHLFKIHIWIPHSSFIVSSSLRHWISFSENSISPMWSGYVAFAPCERNIILISSWENNSLRKIKLTVHHLLLVIRVYANFAFACLLVYDAIKNKGPIHQLCILLGLSIFIILVLDLWLWGVINWLVLETNELWRRGLYLILWCFQLWACNWTLRLLITFVDG